MTHHTDFEVIIGKTVPDNLPDAIDSITVTGPKGKVPIGKGDFTYLPHLRDFWTRMPGIPQKGTYTFEITGAKKRGSASDIQAEIKTIPLPDVKYLSPSNGTALNSDDPIFSWKAVKTEAPLYYRLEIHKLRGGRVYSTGYVKGMISHTVPKGLLTSGQTYRWRIRTADGDAWEKVQNSSLCPWQVFHLR